MDFDKLKSQTIKSPHRSARWTSYGVLAFIGLFIWPFLLLAYLGLKVYNKSSWSQGVRATAVIVLALAFVPLGFAWTGGMFSFTPDEEVETQVTTNLQADDMDSTKARTFSEEEAATTSTSAPEEVFESESINSSDTVQGAEGEVQSENEVKGNTNVTVTRIVDGDTVAVAFSDGTKETLRLIGIDTPETKHPSKPVECFGYEASQKAKEILADQEITLEFDDSQGARDTYGRLLAYIILSDGSNFNQRMIDEGYAYEYTYNLPYRYQSEFKAAQNSARTNERGLWALDTCDGERAASEQEEESQDSEQDDGESKTSESADGLWYTSSHHSAKYYYHESCNGWESLSKSYLNTYNSEELLKTEHPEHELHDDCDI